MNEDKNTVTSEPEWPDALDALTAAPDHHDLLLENERVRVLDSLVKPGERVPVHTHRWPGVLYILGASDFIRYDADGNVVFDSRTAPQFMPESGVVIWTPPLRPHSVENVGTKDLRVVSIELK